MGYRHIAEGSDRSIRAYFRPNPLASALGQKPGLYDFCHSSLDELPEFGTKNLETLRQPLEDRVVTISRASGSLTFPASFVLIAALNPCPCGYFGDPQKECTCSMSLVHRYQKRISGPLMDRIDIHLEVQRVPFQKLSALGQRRNLVPQP